MLFSVLSVSSVLKLLGFTCEREPHPHDPRNDQVRALRLRASVRADGGAACGPLPTIPGALPGWPAAAGWPSWRQILWIIVAMVGARSAAMTMNRIIDLRYDRENPRTRARALATGSLSVGFAGTFALA